MTQHQLDRATGARQQRIRLQQRDPRQHIDRPYVHMHIGARPQSQRLAAPHGDQRIEAVGRQRDARVTHPLPALDLVAAQCGQVQRTTLPGARTVGWPVLRVDAAHPRLPVGRNDLNQVPR